MNTDIFHNTSPPSIGPYGKAINPLLSSAYFWNCQTEEDKATKNIWLLFIVISLVLFSWMFY